MFEIPADILDQVENQPVLNPSGALLQSPNGLKTPRMMKIDAKQRFLSMMKMETLSAVMNELPKPGECWHLISNGKFDFWTFVPVLVKLAGGKVDAMHASTWTLSRSNANEMLAMLKSRQIGAISLLTGEEFKSRETAVYGTLVEGLLKHNQKYLSCANHAKVLLLRNAATSTWLTVEGSANFTSNPRIENYVITNEQNVYEFHWSWIEEMLNGAKV